MGAYIRMSLPTAVTSLVSGVFAGVRESLEREGDLRTSLTGWRLAALCISTVEPHCQARSWSGEDRGEATEMSRGLGDGPCCKWGGAEGLQQTQGRGLRSLPS